MLQRPAIVVPTFERDLCKAIILMKSITKYDPHHFLGDVHVMWVSDQPSWNYQAQVDEMKQAIVATGIRQFKLIDFSEKLIAMKGSCIMWDKEGKNCHSHVTGWFAQQALKLKIASILSSEYYVLLDSKNAFFSEVREDTFFSHCNQAVVHGKYLYDDIPEPHKQWYAASSAALGIKAPKNVYWPTSITPAVLHRQTVLELLQQIGEDPNPYAVCNGPLCTWFGEQATEFTMYNLFAFAKADRDCLHSFLGPWFDAEERDVGLWRSAPYVNLERCEEVATDNVKALTFGIQAGSLDRNKSKDSGNDWLRQRTIDCVAQVYAKAGLGEGLGANASAHDREAFAKCLS